MNIEPGVKILYSIIAMLFGIFTDFLEVFGNFFKKLARCLVIARVSQLFIEFKDFSKKFRLAILTSSPVTNVSRGGSQKKMNLFFFFTYC